MTNCPCPGSGARQRPCLTRAATRPIGFPSRRTRLSTPNAIEVPGSLLAAIQQRLARDDVNAILRTLT